MAKASSRPYRAALTRYLRATGLAQIPEEAPLVELLRQLADELDAGGGSRPRIEWRNALRDARAVLAKAPGAQGASRIKRPKTVPKVEPEEEAAAPKPEVADFESFRRAKGSAAPGPG